jgi:hypothetical protein
MYATLYTSNNNDSFDFRPSINNSTSTPHPWMTGTIVAFSPDNQAQQQNAAASSSGIAPGYKLQPPAQPQPIHGSDTTSSSPTGIPGLP